MSEAESIPGPLCGRMDYDDENFHGAVPQPTPPTACPKEKEK